MRRRRSRAGASHRSADSLLRDTGQGGLQIGHAVADVVDAGPAFRKELRHGTLRIARLEQLDVDVAECRLTIVAPSAVSAVRSES